MKNVEKSEAWESFKVCTLFCFFSRSRQTKMFVRQRGLTLVTNTTYLKGSDNGAPLQNLKLPIYPTRKHF